MKKLMFFVFAILAIGTTAIAQSPGIFHFTGTSFQEGITSDAIVIAAQDGLLPAAADEKMPARAAKLPSGSGGLALLCYLQKSGGKMVGKGGYEPIAGAPIEITGTGIKLMARTNESGYLFLALPVGQYELKFSAFSKNIRINKGKNTLAAMRGGKRMVD